jgi:hypothetical protein
MRFPTSLALLAALLPPGPVLACGRCAPLVAATVYDTGFAGVAFGLASPLLILVALALSLHHLDRFRSSGVPA